MKKLLCLVLALALALSCVSALAETRTKTPAGQLEGARNVYFVITSAFFKDGSDIIVLGQKKNDSYKRYDQPVAITAADDDLLVPVDALSKIFQFDYTYDAATGALHLEDEYVKADLTVGSKDVTIDGAADTLGAAPAEVEGVLCVPAVSVGTKVFALVTGESEGYTYLAYEETALPEGSTGLSGYITGLTSADKVWGVHNPVYWYEEAQMLMPYRLTIPTSYDPEVPNAMVIYLHGGSGDDNRDVERMVNYQDEPGTYWDMLLDEFGFIGLCPNAYAQVDYGKTGRDSDDPNQALAAHLGEMEVFTVIEEVKAKFNIDESRIFVMGNSMGSGGTTNLATWHPGVFAALSPSGGAMGSMDVEALGDTPVRMVCGTEDRNYNNALANYKKYLEQGLNVTFRGVAGGVHSMAWCQPTVLRETFEFFNGVSEDILNAK